MSNVNAHLIASRLTALQSLMTSACHAAGRATDAVQLLCVTKTQSADVVYAAYQAGLRDFGENYAQEGIDKIIALHQLTDINWHFIGPVQSNKTRGIAEHFAWVHSVDRLKIAERLNEQRPPHLPPLNVCIQVNISNEPHKGGCAVADTPALAAAISALPHLKLRGLMAIPAPIDPNASVVMQQAPFAALAELFKQIQTPYSLDTLSMGMSDDFTHAIAQGASIVRIGSALLGWRV